MLQNDCRGLRICGPAARAVRVAARAVLGQLERYRDDQCGVAMVTFALMIVAILGFAALATDVGTVYWQRRELQNGVDGAALAGASALETSSSQAITLANTYANNNGITSAELSAGGGAVVGTTFSSNDTMTVTAKRVNGFGLRYLIGAGDTNILTQAAAIVVAMSPSGIWPFAVSQGVDCSSSCVIKWGAGGDYNGNFGYVALGCRGDQCVQDNIENGYSGSIPGPASYNGSTPVWAWSIDTEPGNKVAATRNGINTLMGWDDGEWCDGGTKSCSNLYVPDPGGYDPSPDTSNHVCYTDTRCPRVGIIPIISQDWSVLNGRSQPVTVVGFQCFYVISMVQSGQGQGNMDVTGKSLGNCYAGGGSGSSAMYGAPIGSTGSYGYLLWK